jgi:F-type H+-transporting ATPase subunit c
MNITGFFRRALVVAFLAFAVTSLMGGQVVYAQEDVAVVAPASVLHYFGAALGLGMIVIGAAFGISKFTAAAAEGIARQPAAAASITGAVNLPLFLLEGVAILAEVFVLLIVLLK